jgi:hypothetical protein
MQQVEPYPDPIDAYTILSIAVRLADCKEIIQKCVPFSKFYSESYVSVIFIVGFL